MIAILVPCYKRPEYTRLTLESLEKNTVRDDVVFFLFDDGSKDKTMRYFQSFGLPKRIFLNDENIGLRDIIINFIESTGDYEYIGKVDNDILVPRDWLSDLLDVHTNSSVDILSPNVMPSDAANRLGTKADGYLKARTVGGLWFMKRSFINGMTFERSMFGGITCAHMLLQQIQTTKDPNIGWTDKVVFQDIGHWSGVHPDHVKTVDHYEYSQEIGREVSWTPRYSE